MMGHGYRVLALALTASLAAFSAPSAAAIISGTWSFNATGAIGAESVVFSGSFTTSFDNSSSVDLSPADITVNALNLLPGFTGSVGAFYLPASDALVFGYTAGGVGGLPANTNDFRVVFSPSGAPANDSFVYSRVGGQLLFNVPIVSTSFTPAGGSWHLPPFPIFDLLPEVTLLQPEVTQPEASVPEPGTVALLAMGLAGIAARRRKPTRT